MTAYEVVKPPVGKTEEIILSGSVDNHKRGVPLSVVITYPDGKSQNFGAALANNGSYKSVISINENSLVGIYQIELSHNISYKSMISFQVSAPEFPDWVKNNAQWWVNGQMSDEDFIESVQYLMKKNIIRI